MYDNIESSDEENNDITNFKDYFTSHLKMNSNEDFEKKITNILTSKNEKNQKITPEIDIQKAFEQQLKDAENEKKIDFILSDEKSFEIFNIKNKEQMLKEEEMKINPSIYKYRSFQQSENLETENSIANTEMLLQREKDKSDYELLNMQQQVKNKNPLLYHKEKIKELKKMKDLQTGLAIEESAKKGVVKGNKKINKINLNKKNNKKDNKKDDLDKEENFNNDDEIISIIQHPINSCTNKKASQNFNNNERLITYSNSNDNDISKKNKNILLSEFKKEKKLKNKFEEILNKNPCVVNNDYFVKNRDNIFYNLNSKSTSLEVAKEILEQKLTNAEKNRIKEMNQNILDIQKLIEDKKNKKQNLIQMISDIKNNLNNIEEQNKKEEFEYERQLNNELHSVINKYKMQLYKQELQPNNVKNAQSEELKDLRNEYKKLKNNYDDIIKNYEKNLIDIQKKIIQKSAENENLIQKINLYEQDKIINKFGVVNPTNKEITQIKNFKEKEINNNNKINFNNDEESNIIKNNIEKKIIKTSSKLNHLNELNFEFPQKYFENNFTKIKQLFEDNGKVIKIFEGGNKEIIFPNKTRKRIYPDGYILVTYGNGDIKEIIPNYKEVYFFKKENAMQIKFDDGYKYVKYNDTGKIIFNGSQIN